MADEAHCQVTVLGACHSAADELTTALSDALAEQSLYKIVNASRLNQLPRDTAEPACWLLCGLDWPCPEAMRARQQREDAWLRTQLASAGLVFRVVYGATMHERLSQAMQAIDAVAPNAITARYRPSALSQRLRPWCEQCSDPDCERKLFPPCILKTLSS